MTVTIDLWLYYLLIFLSCYGAGRISLELADGFVTRFFRWWRTSQ